VLQIVLTPRHEGMSEIGNGKSAWERLGVGVKHALPYGFRPDP